MCTCIETRTHVHTHTQELSGNKLRWIISGLYFGGRGKGVGGAFFIIPLKVSIVSAEGFANFTPACLGIEKEPRHATAGLSPIDEKSDF